MFVNPLFRGPAKTSQMFRYCLLSFNCQVRLQHNDKDGFGQGDFAIVTPPTPHYDKAIIRPENIDESFLPRVTCSHPSSGQTLFTLEVFLSLYLYPYLVS